ncbi:hypothetical protein CupriaWKF_18705 [Cupriavidus sp. WKF15]|uniref:hypothetical protein n=1 Tax=Cupriavidus sp. WKF15 TaxID=3032282 RepID=UPI0023E28369|nr:hypothetical protein [Cupriavidus sp. WKF15]WER49195.1 hypothetical protein CupriaWKF_18705 [Cupriavidus sp. WKF15]
MTTQQYYNHIVEGSATLLSDDTWQGAGSVVQAGAVLVQSGTLGLFRTRERAQAQGLAWAKSWIDTHSDSPAASPAPSGSDHSGTPEPKATPSTRTAPDCAARQLLDIERHICEVRGNLRRQIRFARQLRADGLPTEFTEMLLHTLCQTVTSLRKQRNRLRQQLATASRSRPRSR